MDSDLKLINSWWDIGVDPKGRDQFKAKCPNCKDDRKKKNKTDTPLSIHVSQGVGHCFNCDIKYKILTEPDSFSPVQNKIYKLPQFEKLPISDNAMKFFKSRGIQDRTIEHFKISSSFANVKDEDSNEWKKIERIDFNYYFEGVHTNTKFRAKGKKFSLIGGAKLTFYNIDQVKEADEVFIQEGEMDTLAAWQCGILNSISVPNGASKGNTQLEYIDHCIQYLEHKKKIVLATDDDTAGRSLRDALIRRFGAEKCWTIQYPEGTKDTNEVLLKHGPGEVQRMYAEAKQVPLTGIFSSEEVQQQALDIYDNGYPPTAKIGYQLVYDQLVSYKGGELTTITGVPGHGKSTFIDQVLVKLAARHEWKIAMFSPENITSVHTHKLVAKYIGKKTLGRDRASREMFITGCEFVTDHFFFMKYDEMNTSLDGILVKAKELVTRCGVNAIVIDPYNCIDHQIPRGYTETQYINEILTKLTSFAKRNWVHIFLVAHPTKMDKIKDTERFEVPNLYKISGSAHFYNKTDNGMTVYILDDIVQVIVQKIKFDYVGEKGVAEFKYDRETGRYAEIDATRQSDPNYRPVFENEYEIRLKRLAKEAQGVQGDLVFEEIIEVIPDPSKVIPALTDIKNLQIPVPASFGELRPTDEEPPF